MDDNDKQYIPYIAHEADMARMERSNKRFWILLIITICLLVATNAAWIAYESQFQYVTSTEQEVEQDADSDGNNSFVGGDYYGIPAEGNDDNSKD